MKAAMLDMRAVMQRTAADSIWRARDKPQRMKARVMAAWEMGLLTAEEAEVWIVLRGLEAE